jgi:hypothetical protein
MQATGGKLNKGLERYRLAMPNVNKGQASWAKVTINLGQTNRTGMPPDQKVNKAE